MSISFKNVLGDQSEKKKIIVINSQIASIPDLWFRGKGTGKYFLCPSTLSKQSFYNAASNRFTPSSDWLKIPCQVLESKFCKYHWTKIVIPQCKKECETTFSIFVTNSSNTVLHWVFPFHNADEKIVIFLLAMKLWVALLWKVLSLHWERGVNCIFSSGKFQLFSLGEQKTIVKKSVIVVVFFSIREIAIFIICCRRC